MLSRMHWYFIVLFGLTCFGSSYFFFAASSLKPVASVNVPFVPTSQVDASSGGKADCGDGVCVSPENSDRCPADCSL